MDTFKHEVEKARTLEELLAAIATHGDDSLSADRLMSHLPTFGGEEPNDTAKVWSWDEKRLLIGTSRDDFRIVPR